MSRLSPILLRIAVTVAMVLLALIVGVSLWNYYLEAPWTRDGRVQADVVAIAPDVSGLVTEVLVSDNQDVKRGDILFRVDPDRYQIALRQAEANVDGMQAVAEQKAADYQRYSHLSETAVSQQKIEEARAADLQAKADVLRAIADRDLAKLNLDRSTVRARVNGRVANVTLRPGAYVTVGKGVFALIDSDTLRVEGYFEETKLDQIHVGDIAKVQLMGNGTRLQGRVESITGGIEDRERSEGSTLLANVNPTFSWVRLAQRIPVRIKLDAPPDDLRLIVGRTATVAIESATAATPGNKN